MVSDYNRALSDRKSRAESYAQWSIRVGGETETIEKALSENNSRLATLESSYSNVDRVNMSVTVRGRCTRVVLGTCADNQGGKYEGTVRFQLEYVGTPGAISAANDAVLRRVDAALQRFEQEAQAIRQQQQQQQQAQTGASCPSTYTPGQPTRAVAELAFFNEWSNPVTVMVYTPQGQRNSIVVPPGVNHVIASGVTTDWGVCLVDKPNIRASGVVNYVSDIANFDPNWGDRGLWMIQNPRIR